MRLLLVLFYLLSTLPVHATLNEVDKTQIFNKNLLVNGGFESGKQKWTASAGTFAVTTSSPMIGLQHATWDAAASADTLTSTALAIPVGMYGRNGAVSCLITTASGTATHTIQAYDGSNILASASVTSSTSPTRTTTNFIFPSSGNISLRLYANADEPSVALDDCYLGPAEGYNTDSVSQASEYGSLTYPGKASCEWARTSNATFADFSADTDCDTAVVTGNASIPATKLPAVKFANLPPGNYLFVATSRFAVVTASQQCSFRFSDGTNGTSPNIIGSTAGNGMGTITGRISYTTAQSNITIGVQTTGVAANNDCRVDAQVATTTGFAITVYRFPTTSEQTFTPDKYANSWSGYHDATCSWARTNAAYGAPTDDATCVLVQSTNTNFGTVSTSGNVSPAITFTPSGLFKYEVCANVYINMGTSGSQIGAQMLDGAATVIADTSFIITSNGSSVTQTLCGLWTPASIAAQTISIQTKASGGAVTISSGNGVSSIRWKIVAINQPFPASLITNAVTSPYLGVTHTAVAKLNCDAGSAITSQLGTWVSSIGNISGGACAVVIAGGIFSATPYCSASVDAAFASVGLIVAANATSATAVSIDCEQDESTACTAHDTVLTCTGAK